VTTVHISGALKLDLLGSRFKVQGSRFELKTLDPDSLNFEPGTLNRMKGADVSGRTGS
jgi:hypothetical protein